MILPFAMLLAAITIAPLLAMDWWSFITQELHLASVQPSWVIIFWSKNPLLREILRAKPQSRAAGAMWSAAG
jgi:hypothetical protein